MKLLLFIMEADMQNLSKNNQTVKEFLLIEKLIRRTYHDGANLFGPLKEIISLKLDDALADYLNKNLAYYLMVLKNLRFFYLLTQRPDFFEEEDINLKEVLKDLMLDLADLNFSLSEDIIENSNIPLRCLREPFYMILYNLLTNALRFGENLFLEILPSENILVIANKLRSPATGHNSLFHLPVSEDKYGIMGTGVGLKIVEKAANFIKIKIDSNIQEDMIKVYVDFKALIV